MVEGVLGDPVGNTKDLALNFHAGGGKTVNKERKT